MCMCSKLIYFYLVEGPPLTDDLATPLKGALATQLPLAQSTQNAMSVWCSMVDIIKLYIKHVTSIYHTLIIFSSHLIHGSLSCLLKRRAWMGKTSHRSRGHSNNQTHFNTNIQSNQLESCTHFSSSEVFNCCKVELTDAPVASSVTDRLPHVQ